MFNSAIQTLKEKTGGVSDSGKTPTPAPSPVTSLSEQDFIEPEPEGKEETMLSPVPPKPVDVKVWTSQIKNPA